MATEIKLPRLGQGMESGTVVRWLKQEGERVEEGEVPVGQTIAVVGEEGEAVPEAEPEPEPEPEEAPDEAPEELPEEEGSRAPARDEERERGREAAVQAEPQPEAPQPSAADGRAPADQGLGGAGLPARDVRRHDADPGAPGAANRADA